LQQELSCLSKVVHSARSMLVDSAPIFYMSAFFQAK
jgi:hypothetical protein